MSTDDPAFVSKARFALNRHLAVLLDAGDGDDGHTRRRVASRVSPALGGLSGVVTLGHVERASDLRARVAIAWIAEATR